MGRLLLGLVGSTGGRALHSVAEVPLKRLPEEVEPPHDLDGCDKHHHYNGPLLTQDVYEGGLWS